MAPSVEPERKSSSNDDEKNSPPNLRRSGRARKPRVLDGEKEAIVKPPPKINGSKSPPVQNGESSRRNPKRKASEIFDVPDYLLDASLEAWNENEREEWPSWTEVESDPAFFNRIINLLGVKQASLQEVYSVDPESLANLPAPVYGLIFLYQYFDREEDADPSEVSPNLWFANQTTSNACATVALFNIIMNAEGLELGEKLDKFKQESKDMVPPLRGNLLSNSTWIRVAHNSFARRVELLNAALSLSNRVEASESRRPAKKPNTKASRKKPKKKPDEDAGYHFIAFIPMNGKVWQLDGLETTPRCIGEFNPDQHWTSIVSPELADRMGESETQMLSFNLLALHGNVEEQTNGDEEAIPGRKKDHTPAIHEWVKKLADHSALANLHQEVKIRKSP